VRRILLAAAVAAAIAAQLLGTSAAGAESPPIAPIGPNQFFNGLINGAKENAIIRMACFGPEPVGGRTGHPLAGQNVAVSGPLAISPVSIAGVGFTGLADSINATLYFATPVVGTQPGGTPLATFRFYNDPAPISTELTLPCSGRGVAVFNPVMGGEKARPARVSVSFVGQP
jgi:hypothetical protein